MWTLLICLQVRWHFVIVMYTSMPIANGYSHYSNLASARLDHHCNGGMSSKKSTRQVRRPLTSELAFVVLTACGTRALSQKCANAECRELRPSTVCQPLFVHTCFDKNAIWVHYNALAYDFTSVVLMRMLPGALNSFSLPMTSLFCCVESTSWYQLFH